MKTKIKVSAGGVLFRRNQGTFDIALIILSGGRIKALPKGEVEEGENIEQAALREVAEETGCQAKLIEKLGVIDYWFFVDQGKTRIHKFVHYYLMEYVSGSVEEHDWEVEDVRWYSLDEAIEEATYKNEREIIRKAAERIRHLYS